MNQEEIYADLAKNLLGCRHRKSGVTNTGDPESSRFKSTRYNNAITRRRRKCLDCGENFTTLEVTLDFHLNHLTPELSKEMAYHSILKDFSDFISKKVSEDE